MKIFIVLVSFFCFNVCTLNAQFWSITGNNGTVAGPNFVGTIDSADLMFKVFDARSGYLSARSNNSLSFGYQALLASSGTSNAAFGYNALMKNTTGSYNIALGFYALNTNTTGSYNSATGMYALNKNKGGSNNTASGYTSLYSNTSGNSNTANGYSALYTNTTGSYNSAAGMYTLYKNKSGSNNTADGYSALQNNSSGYSNTAEGVYALYSNTVGHNLIAIGDSALYSNNSNGIQNTAVGSKAGYAVTTAAYNSFFGFNSGKATTTGNYNTAVGSEALKANTTGASNSTVGEKSMISNTTGRENTAEGSGSLQNNVIGNDNVANGFWSLYNNTTGYSNVAIGVRAMYKSTDANNLVAVGDSALYNQASVNGGEFSPPANNTAVGSKSLYANTGGANNTATGFQAANLNSTGSANTAIGFLALFNNVTGANNTAIGALADVTSSSLNNATAIGQNAKVNASNKMQLGSSTTVLATSSGYTIVSDGRFKENIKQDDLPGLAFINKLNPVSYNFNYSRFNDFLNQNVTDKSKLKDAGYLKQLAEKSKLRESGFIAQEVDKICRDNKYVFTGVYTPQNDNDNYALDYSRFVVPLVKAVQELSTQNDELKNQNTVLTAKVADLQKQMNDLKSIVLSANQTNSATTNKSTVILTNASLDQNIPNPFNNTTTINYCLPQQFSSAKIIITDKTGKTLKELNVSGRGKGSIKLDATTLSSGAYQYSLIANGKLIDTKQMILTR